MAGLVDQNPMTGCYLNHIAPMVPMVNDEVFYVHLRDHPANIIESNAVKETIPKPNKASTEELAVQEDNDYCCANDPICTHDPGMPPDSSYNPMLDLVR